MDAPVTAYPVLDVKATKLCTDIINTCGARHSWLSSLWAAWGQHHVPPHAAACPSSLSSSVLAESTMSRQSGSQLFYFLAREDFNPHG